MFFTLFWILKHCFGYSGKQDKVPVLTLYSGEENPENKEANRNHIKTEQDELTF
jgi:hypothetical protein